MPLRRNIVLALPALAALAACSRSDPQAALEAAVQALQDGLESKQTGAVLDLLDEQFRAQDNLDRAWAQRTMTLVFLRYADVKIVAPLRRSHIDPNARHVGWTEAQVLLAGAQGLLPERAAPYSVKLQWRHDGKRWKLFALEWE